MEKKIDLEKRLDKLIEKCKKQNEKLEEIKNNMLVLRGLLQIIDGKISKGN